MDEQGKKASAQRREATRSMPTVEIDMGLAYEFVESLIIYHEYLWHEKNYDYEIGDAWFENIRTSCSQELMQGLANFTLQIHPVGTWGNCGLHSWSHLLSMIYDSPVARDVPNFLDHLETLEPLELRLYWLGYYRRDIRKIIPLDIILRTAEGDEEALAQFFKAALPTSLGAKEREVIQERARWLVSTDGATVKATLLKLLWDWYEQVFRSQEEQFRLVLERDAEEKRKLQASVSPEKLVELATNGLIYGPEAGVRKLVLVPSFLGRPWNETLNYQDIKLIVYPVADESVLSAHAIPSVQLVRLYQALADERRLRIVKMLKRRSYALQEISDEFGVAKSTMHHHLGLLRTAGLVRIRDDDKLYSLRPEALSRVSALLEDYLNSP